jgi:beta-mannosidase
VDLGGTWLGVVADDDRRRTFAEPDMAEDDWAPLEVPGHWRSAEAFATTDGPVLARRRFEHDTAPGADAGEGRRRWLVLDGIFYQGDIWLDGAYLGDTEGYFVPHAFEITALLAARAEHLLAIEATCTPQTDRAAKRNLTGVFQHWDCLDPDWNPGGIWRPVRVEETGPVRIRDLRVLCREATPQRAVVVCRANLETVEATTVIVRSSIGAVDHELTQPLAGGENRVEWTITIERPELWWPWALGDQPLHEVVVEVAPADRPDEVSHRRDLRTGLRTVALDDWICTVNGERLFLKGANQGPTRMALAEATAEELSADVALVKATGLDLLRVHAHITRPELYDAADEAGLLLWQDLPLQWGYARTVRKQAMRQAAAAVRVLGHHPSIALWCGHNEPMALDIGPAAHRTRASATSVARRMTAAQQLPNWNRTILDRSIKRVLTRADGTRPVIAHSGVFPHLPALEGTDSHLYFGWYHGEERDLSRLLAAVPRLARFVSEFGAQAVPVDAAFCEPERWPELDWDHLAHTHALQKLYFDRYVPPAAHATFASWQAATQQYQAELVRHHVEHLRRLKYRPTGGFAQFCFADGHPGVTWSVLGHDRAPKLGHAALTAACAPVIVVADRLPADVAPGSGHALDVHVVSDLRRRIDDLDLTATLTWPGGAHRWRFAGDCPPDDCVRVGTLQLEVPAAEAGAELVLDLSLTGPDVAATNRYTTLIGPS